MALIKTIPPQDADLKVSELYSEAERLMGSVPKNVQMLAISPVILENQLRFADYFMDHPTLSMPFLSMVRLLVSRACGSAYCERMNVLLLRRQGFNTDQIEAAKTDPRNALLSENEKSLLLFVLKAVNDPRSVSAQDMEELHGAGWNDRDIFDAVAHGARSVAVSIVLDTFKI